MNENRDLLSQEDRDVFRILNESCALYDEYLKQRENSIMYWYEEEPIEKQRSMNYPLTLVMK